LHTVIITDPYITSLFGGYRHLFAPFLSERGGSVSHCRWRKGCDDIARAVPDLYKEIKGRPEWRAIILVRPEPEELFNPDNPFDFKRYHENASGNDEKEEILGERPAELVRLAYMLSGLPPLGIKGYETGYVYYDKETGTNKECTFNNERIQQRDFEKEIDDAVRKRLDEDYRKKNIPVTIKEVGVIKAEEKRKFDEIRKKIEDRLRKYRELYDVKPRLLETPYSAPEIEKHKELAKTYAFKENRPAEVLILSIREQHVSDEREETLEEVRRVWQFHDEVDSSDFWKVYPNACRFICYDLINPEHTLYDRELWRFFLLTLTLAVNQIPGRSLQAYLLYNANLQIDAGELGTVYEKYLGTLLPFQEIVRERVSRVPELTQDKNEELVPDKYVEVDFAAIEESDVKAKYDKFGFAADCPEDEALLWHEHIRGTGHVVEDILFAPQEIVAEKALETRRNADSYAGIERVLDRFQINRVQKRIEGLESRVVNTDIYGMLDIEKYKEEVAKAGNGVREFLKTRPTKSCVILISTVSLLVYFCGFLPYLVNSAMKGGPEFGAALGLVIAALALIAGGALLVLCFLRYRLVNKVKNYNKDVTNIFDRIKSGARVFSNYFSDVCTYMYARSILSGVILKKDNDNSAAAILKAHLNFLRIEIERGGSICSLFGAPLNASSKGSLTNIDEEILTKWPSKCQFYELTPCNEENTVRLTASPVTRQIMNDSTDSGYDEWEQYNSGITLNAPYGFITRINIVREEMYDKKEEK